MRKKIAAANWKMNTRFEEGKSLLNEIVAQNLSLKEHQQAIFAVPFPYLTMAADAVAANGKFAVAAQNCYHKESGAYTGEVAAAMLDSVNIRYCIVGHSERREYFGETNDILAEKVNLCFKNNITPVFCCGEPLNIRETHTENAFVENQLRDSLFHLDAAQISRIIIAYEPIWAIGTGKTATAEQAQAMHAHIRSVLAAQYGEKVADIIPILYGGSVKGANAAEIFSQKDVDGGLVGGASLNAAEFTTIIKSLP